MRAGALPRGRLPIEPGSEEHEQLCRLAEVLEAVPEGQAKLVSAEGELVAIPASASAVLAEAVQDLERGHAVLVSPVHATLTTQQAAALLGVSRPHLVGLLDRGTIPSFRVGSHRRVRLADLLAYQRRVDNETEDVLDQLIAESEDLGLPK